MAARRADVRPGTTAIAFLFAAALAVSSFLMFMAEPLIAKAVLPTLGGSPMVWNTCVLFFQLMLLAGYAYAHAAHAWLTPNRYAAAFAVLVLIPIFTLPLGTPAAVHPPAHPVAWLFLALVRSIGVPFFVLSTTASVMQTMYAAATRRDPYFLYVSSNFGSLLALLAYPVVMEPWLRVRDQRLVWTVAYVVFAVLVVACTLAVRRPIAAASDAPSRATTDREDARASEVSAWTRATWTALSFIPSSLMLGVTRYLATDIAALPLLWIIPLALYLGTFIVAFSRYGIRAGRMAHRWLPLLLIPVAMLMAARLNASLWVTVPLHLLTFVAAALLCHCELAGSRPSRSAVTDFYLWIAVGGTLGGVFNTLVAPLLFNDIVEYPLLLVVACLPRALRSSTGETPQRSMMDLAMPVVVGGLAAGLVIGWQRLAGANPSALLANPSALLALVAVPGLLSFSRARRPVQFAACIGALLLAGTWTGRQYGRVLYAERTFFGIHRVTVDASNRYRALFDGTTLHGLEALDPARQNEPLTYYHRTGPFGEAFGSLPHLSSTSEIGVVGLGIGSLASYANGNQRWTFYELDPAVDRIARTHFTFLDRCGSRCRVVLGDARLTLADARPHAYSLLVLDAFSSDAIPLHLLTTEALSVYLSRLAPGGVLAFHVSNRHLMLWPVLARLASNAGLTSRFRGQYPTAEDAVTGRRASEWIVMARQEADLGSLATDPRWLSLMPPASTPLWTDDFSSMLSVLNINPR